MSEPQPTGGGAPPGGTAPRAALLLAVASLACLPLLGLGAVPGLAAAAGAWFLAHRTMARPDRGGAHRSLARLAFFLALAGTAGHGLLLLLILAKVVRT